MNYLLDTHAFLWFLNEDSALSASATTAIEDPSNVIHLSIASLWEIAIKVRIGKLELPESFAAFIRKQLEINSRIRLLAISLDHLEVTTSTPLLHRDPFDRLLIAQAIHENLTVITNDATFAIYPVERFW